MIDIRLGIRERGTPNIKLLQIKLPAVPRVGDYIALDERAVEVVEVLWTPGSVKVDVTVKS